MGKFSPLVSTPTHTLLVAFDQYNLRGKIMLYICILSLAQQHFPQRRSGFAQSVLQLFVLMIPPMCTSSPLWFTYSEMPSFSFFSGVSDLSPFITSVRHLPGFELPLSFLASSSLKREPFIDPSDCFRCIKNLIDAGPSALVLSTDFSGISTVDRSKRNSL